MLQRNIIMNYRHAFEIQGKVEGKGGKHHSMLVKERIYIGEGGGGTWSMT